MEIILIIWTVNRQMGPMLPAVDELKNLFVDKLDRHSVTPLSKRFML